MYVDKCVKLHVHYIYSQSEGTFEAVKGRIGDLFTTMTTLTYTVCYALQVKFSNMVQWMSLEFDSRCGFAQPEDKIGELLIPRRSGLAPTTQPQSASKQNSPPVVSPYVDVSFDDLYSDWDRYALTIPPGVVLLPGQCMSVASTPLLVRDFTE